jgi:hypothetical protein
MFKLNQNFVLYVLLPGTTKNVIIIYLFIFFSKRKMFNKCVQRSNCNKGMNILHSKSTGSINLPGLE